MVFFLNCIDRNSRKTFGVGSSNGLLENTLRSASVTHLPRECVGGKNSHSPALLQVVDEMSCFQVFPLYFFMFGFKPPIQ